MVVSDVISPELEVAAPSQEEQLLGMWKYCQFNDDLPNNLKIQTTTALVEHFEAIMKAAEETTEQPPIFSISGVCRLWSGKTKESGYYGRIIGKEVPSSPWALEPKPFNDQEAKLKDFLPLLGKHLLEFHLSYDPHFTWMVDWHDLRTMKPVRESVEHEEPRHNHDLLHIGSVVVHKIVGNESKTPALTNV